VADELLSVTLFKFKHNNQLQSYILSKKPQFPDIFNIHQLFEIFTQIISAEDLYDSTNASIIVCNPRLELAFNLPFLYVANVKTMLYHHLIQLPDEIQTHEQQLPMIVHDDNNLPPQTFDTAKTSVCQPTKFVKNIFWSTNQAAKTSVCLNRHDFTITDNLRRLLESIPSFPQKRKQFSFKEIILYLMDYILVRKHILFDYRDIKICQAKNDYLLKNALQVDIFHRAQFFNLIRKQLIFVK